jgi:hypothetical protein
MRFARPTLPRPITIDVVVASALGAAALVGALVEPMLHAERQWFGRHWTL